MKIHFTQNFFSFNCVDGKIGRDEFFFFGKTYYLVLK